MAFYKKKKILYTFNSFHNLIITITPHLGIFLTAESKVLTKISQSGPWSPHQPLLLPMPFAHDIHSTSPDMLLPQVLYTYSSGLAHYPANIYLACSVIYSGPMLLL